jgi:hypothetical protein
LDFVIDHHYQQDVLDLLLYLYLMLRFVGVYDEVQLVTMFGQYLQMTLIMNQVNYRIMLIEDLIKDNRMAKKQQNKMKNLDLN